MKKSSFGKFSLLFGMLALLPSCERKDEPEPAQKGDVATTSELAREARFSPWTSKAGLQLKMESLEGNQYFSTVEGRLKDGANQYRAITESFDEEKYRQWSVVWGFTESELFLHEIRLLRAGFHRHNSQVFTDSAGVALHQLTMLLRAGETGGSLPPIVDTGRSSNYTPSTFEEPVQEEVPDFIQPELRRIDDPIPSMDELTLDADPIEEKENSTTITQGTEETKPSEVMEVTADPSKPAEPIMVEDVEEPKPEPKVEEPKPEPKVEEPKPEPKVEEPKPEPKPAPKPKVVSHRVVKGDTLSSIARRYKVRVSDIKSANGLRSDMIRLKQVLKIPKK
jgi:LysM repeat protein